jgi:NAD(P) transhydrogenase subunit beta
MLSQNVINIVYVFAAILFILDLKWMAHPRTAVRGNQAGMIGMLVAIVATLLSDRFDWSYILIGVAVGALIGGIAALRVKMTNMPEMVGLFNGFGGAASVLVAGSALIAAISSPLDEATAQMKVATVASAIIGSVTFFGSYVAFGKLAEFLAVKWKLHMWQKAIKYGFSLVVVAGGTWYALAAGILPQDATTNQKILAALLMLSALIIGGILLIKKDRFPGMNALKISATVACLALGVLVYLDPSNFMLFWVLAGAGGVLGVVLTLSIGGADMPVVIALLNSYSGLAACATGFVINNTVLIIATRRRRGLQDGQGHLGRRDRHAARRRSACGHRSRVRHGRGPGAARGALAGQSPREQRSRGRVRDSPRGRPHAGAHERPAGRGRRALR